MQTGTKPRNQTLDLIRGYFLTAILVAHFYKFPSPYVFLNGRGEMWVSAAPGFVFVSGLLVGMVYKRKIETLGIKPALKKLIERGLKLQAFNVFFTVTYSLLGVYMGTWQYLNMGLLHKNLFDAFINAATFRYSYGWADLLIYYAFMLIFVSPVVLYLFNKRIVKPVIAASGLIWLAMFILPGEQRFSGSYIPIESWQFLFVLGLTGGYFKNYFAQQYRILFHSGNKSNVYLLFIVFAVTIMLSIADRFNGMFTGDVKTVLNIWFKKADLAPGLLVTFFIWFTALYYIFQRLEIYITKYLGWLLYTFGKNSLLTYSIQSIYLFALFYILPKGGTYWVNTLTTTALILVVWLTVKLALIVKNKLQHD